MASADMILDWRLIRTFLAVAETGSFSAAARRLRSSQPTVGRQIEALERDVETPLFQRVPEGMRLTPEGAALVEHARAMQDAARRFGLGAAGASEALSGTVRITASVAMAHTVLPALVARIGELLPEIAIEIDATDATSNLLFREADIALRMFRPTQLDVISRHVCDVPLGLFGAVSYLDRAGRPEGVEDLFRHRLVGYDRDDRIIRGFRERGIALDRDAFRTRTDLQSVYWELVRAGCGLGFWQRHAGRADPGVEQVLPDLDLPALPVWLTAHAAMRRTPRVRAVWDLLTERLPAMVS